MNKIESYYKEAVKGITESLLEDRDKWYNYVLELPKHLQIVYTVAVFHNQVMNGGLHQYFLNSYGSQFAYMTIRNLNEIKAYLSSEILSKAVKYINNYDLSENLFRQQKLEKIKNFDEELGDILDGLDTQYYELKEDLELLLNDYFFKNGL